MRAQVNSNRPACSRRLFFLRKASICLFDESHCRSIALVLHHSAIIHALLWRLEARSKLSQSLEAQQYRFGRSQTEVALAYLITQSIIQRKCIYHYLQHLVFHFSQVNLVDTAVQERPKEEERLVGQGRELRWCKKNGAQKSSLH